MILTFKTNFKRKLENMNKLIKLSLITTIALSTVAFAEKGKDVKTPKEAKDLTEMFSDGEVSGQIRLGYATNRVKTSGDKDTYATAAGGQLKYETASLMGVSFGAAMQTSHSINGLSGRDDKYNNELASNEKSYTELAEAYVNFSYEGFEFRGGRQLIDTPLADSDDIRMTPHTFEAYIASYTFKDLGLAFIVGNILSWQGVDSETNSGEPYANVENNVWAETGADGTRLGAITYASDYVEASLWYYDVTKETTAFYADVVGTIPLGDEAEIVLAAQYLNEKEQERSETEGSIIGAMVEASFYGVTLTGAYNQVKVKDDYKIFEGFGGGSSYTNLDTMTAGALHDGSYGDGSSFMLGAAYEIAGFTIFGAYGDYRADAIAGGDKAHVTEMNFGLEYEYNDGEADIALIYAIGKDKESSTKTEFDNDRIQVVLNYNF